MTVTLSTEYKQANQGPNKNNENVYLQLLFWCNPHETSSCRFINRVKPSWPLHERESVWTLPTHNCQVQLCPTSSHSTTKISHNKKRLPLTFITHSTATRTTHLSWMPAMRCLCSSELTCIMSSQLHTQHKSRHSRYVCCELLTHFSWITAWMPAMHYLCTSELTCIMSSQLLIVEEDFLSVLHSELFMRVFWLSVKLMLYLQMNLQYMLTYSSMKLAKLSIGNCTMTYLYGGRLSVHSGVSDCCPFSNDSRVLTTDSVVPQPRCHNGAWNIGQADVHIFI